MLLERAYEILDTPSDEEVRCECGNVKENADFDYCLRCTKDIAEANADRSEM